MQFVHKHLSLNVSKYTCKIKVCSRAEKQAALISQSSVKSLFVSLRLVKRGGQIDKQIG